MIIGDSLLQARLATYSLEYLKNFPLISCNVTKTKQLDLNVDPRGSYVRFIIFEYEIIPTYTIN